MNRECNHPTCGDTCRREVKEKKLYKIQPYSKSRQVVNRLYNARARIFRNNNPVCVINSPVCTKYTEGVHHRKGRGKYLMDERFWMPACNRCNGYIEDHSLWAQENGFKESKFN